MIAPGPDSIAKAFCAVMVAAVLAACSPRQSNPVIVAGNVRFEFLTPSLVRMEYSSSGRFVDAPTAVVQKRDWPKTAVETQQKDGWLVAATPVLTLRYRLGSGELTAANLQITFKDATGVSRTWHPGDTDPLNLGGMPYSLDNISEENLPPGRSDTLTPLNDVIPGIDVKLAEAKPGLLSRAGYAFIDDSSTPVWNAARTWIEPRQPQPAQDWYFFVYGSDYHRVLREYAQLCGPVPMIPRYVLGPMVTDFNFEYFPDSAEALEPQFKRYNQQHLQDELARLRQSQIPFDTLVLDFAWHNYGWDGGFDWSPLFPSPSELSNWLHSRGIKLSLNDHPGYANTDESILSFSDSHAPEVLKELGGAPVPTPAFNLDTSKGWSFAPDRHGRWKPILVGHSWQEQGFKDDQGIGWYRTTVRLPSRLPAKLYLYLGEVRKEYRIFVNGKEAAHSRIRWPQRLTYTDITPYIVAGRENEILLRVQAGERGGGLILGPTAIRAAEPPQRIYFDLSNQHQAQISMRDLHGPLMRGGVDFWWVDGGSGAVDMPGLNKQLWTNKMFYDFTQEATGRRGFILGRYGDWGSERYPAFFTGDTYSQWPVLAYEVAFTARGGNVLVDYISHDIGGFHGAKIAFDLYARWIEFGAFSPILRMHSAHANPLEGNLRMPWDYGDEGTLLMKKYFTLRTQLIPYLYTYTWRAHRDSVPILRPLYFETPELEEAYRHSREYFFGREMLIAPVVDPSGNQSIYLPPGEWMDFFTGKRYSGGVSLNLHYDVSETPVFVREGSIIPEQPPGDYSDAKPLDTVILNVYGGGEGHFDLYEDDGISLAYDKGQSSVTSLTHSTDAQGVQHLVIDPTRGSFKGQVAARTFELHIHTPGKPGSISLNGKYAGPVSWDAAQATATVTLPRHSIRDRIEVTWR
jgi:alpha-glucosidase (family GH31 glycosyl hydrolase)